MSRIDFDHVCKSYGPRLPHTIQDANLSIRQGEFCVFVGPSGCGKSTLLRMVAGLEDVTSGNLSIGGRRVNDLAPAKRGVAMVFQSYALYPHMTVAQNMSFGLRVMGSDKQAIDQKVRRAADILQLGSLMDRLPKELSGGQRQRVAIGRAIVKEPDVFLFDEPLSNLDAALRVQTRLEIAKLHHDIGSASMIYVTHDQVEAMTLADKIVLLRSGPDVQTKGSVAQFGTPMDLYHRPQNLFVAEFIGSPKMNMLPCRLVRAEETHAVVDLLGQHVEVAVDARSAGQGDELKLGFRPEHVQLGEAGAGARLQVQVRHTERLGDSSLVYAALDPRMPLLTIKVEGSMVAMPGTPLTLRMAAEHGHLFNSAGDSFRRAVELPV